MCFKVVSSAKIAEANIPCYKVLETTPFFWLGFYKSRHYTKLWSILDFLFCKKVKLEPDYYNDINEGYHSFISKEQAIRAGYSDARIIKFYIPKGATYYINEERGHYVSDKIYRRL